MVLLDDPSSRILVVEAGCGGGVTRKASTEDIVVSHKFQARAESASTLCIVASHNELMTSSAAQG